MKKLLSLLLMLAMLPCAFAEEMEDEWLFIDLSGEQIVTYDSVPWDFPVRRSWMPELPPRSGNTVRVMCSLQEIPTLRITWTPGKVKTCR